MLKPSKEIPRDMIHEFAVDTLLSLDVTLVSIYNVVQRKNYVTKHRGFHHNQLV
jgi:hypothetical protein